MTTVAPPAEMTPLRERRWVIRWTSHLVYFVLLGTLVYATRFGADSTEWTIRAAMTPFVVLAVIMRVRFPYALPLLGMIEIAAGIGYSVYTLGAVSLAIRRRGLPVWAFLSVGGAIGGFQVYHSEVGDGSSPAGALISAGVWALTLSAVPTMVGGYIRSHRELQAAAAERAARTAFEHDLAVREARLEERDRIAQEMHDSLGHVLAQVSMQAGAMEVRARDPEDVSAAERIRETARSGLVELRAVVQTLGEDARLDPAPTLSAVPRLIEASRNAGAAITFDDELADAVSLPSPTGRAVHQVVREALTNAHRHAPAAPVHIVLAGAPGAGVTITAENPLTPRGDAGAGTGLRALERRAAALGGTLEARASRGRFTLKVHLPWEVAS